MFKESSKRYGTIGFIFLQGNIIIIISCFDGLSANWSIDTSTSAELINTMLA